MYIRNHCILYLLIWIVLYYLYYVFLTNICLLLRWIASHHLLRWPDIFAQYHICSCYMYPFLYVQILYRFGKTSMPLNVITISLKMSRRDEISKGNYYCYNDIFNEIFDIHLQKCVLRNWNTCPHTHTRTLYPRHWVILLQQTF